MPEPTPATGTSDPLLRNSRREALVIGLAWVAATTYCCVYSYLFGYDRPGFHPTREDVRPTFGIPSWVLWGYLAPWLVCGLFTVWFAAWFVADDDLGRDRADGLDGEVTAR